MISAIQRQSHSFSSLYKEYKMISTLIELSENERMHLLIWLQISNPNYYEKFLLMLIQIVYVPYYTALYAVSPKTAHKFVSNLEKQAILQYTKFLDSIDKGYIENIKPPQIAINCK
jgi:ubiquinol oxidase